MDTALKPLNKKKAVAATIPDFHFDVEEDRWGDGTTLKLFQKQREILEGEVSSLNCCAFNEVHNFQFFQKLLGEYNEKLQKAFNEGVQTILQKSGGSYQIFILSKPLGKPKALQPEWFVQCLENYPSAVALDWTPNYTYNPVISEVKMYLLPTLKA
jgi:hypothetical protein